MPNPPPQPPSSTTTRRHGARAAAPIAVAVVGFGLAFGVLARDAGFDVLSAAVMSATTFAGSAQFAAVLVLGDGGTVAAAVIAGALLNARYAPMGVTIAPGMGGPWYARLLRAQLLVDESWAVAQTPHGVDLQRMIGAGTVLWLAWTASTALGVVLADVVADPATLGLDAAFPALFLYLLVDVVGDRRAAMVAVAAGAVALALTPVLPAGLPLVVAAVVALVGWWQR